MFVCLCVSLSARLCALCLCVSVFRAHLYGESQICAGTTEQGGMGCPDKSTRAAAIFTRSRIAAGPIRGSAGVCTLQQARLFGRRACSAERVHLSGTSFRTEGSKLQSYVKGGYEGCSEKETHASRKAGERSAKGLQRQRTQTMKPCALGVLVVHGTAAFSVERQQNASFAGERSAKGTKQPRASQSGA